MDSLFNFATFQTHAWLILELAHGPVSLSFIFTYFFEMLVSVKIDFFTLDLIFEIHLIQFKSKTFKKIQPLH